MASRPSRRRGRRSSGRCRRSSRCRPAAARTDRRTRSPVGRPVASAAAARPRPPARNDGSTSVVIERRSNHSSPSLTAGISAPAAPIRANRICCGSFPTFRSGVRRLAVRTSFVPAQPGRHHPCDSGGRSYRPDDQGVPGWGRSKKVTGSSVRSTRPVTSLEQRVLQRQGISWSNTRLPEASPFCITDAAEINAWTAYLLTSPTTAAAVDPVRPRISARSSSCTPNTSRWWVTSQRYPPN